MKTQRLLPGSKNAGLTHLVSAAYRMHPMEFQIGQAAGVMAVIKIAQKCQLNDMLEEEEKLSILNPSEKEKRLRKVQHELLKVKTPRFWNTDCGWNTEYFLPVQLVCALEIMRPHGMTFAPEKILTKDEAEAAAAKLGGGNSFLKEIEGKEITRGAAARILYNELARRFDLPMKEGVATHAE